jgi:hypothetical protein
MRRYAPSVQRVAVATGAIVLAACQLVAPPVLREGNCTLTLTQQGNELTAPYRAVIEMPVDLHAAGWRGDVSVSAQVPDGTVDRSGLDAASLNGDAASMMLDAPGRHHYVMADEGGCRQEFDIQALPRG